MTDKQHPLTDEMCDALRRESSEIWSSGFSYENMRRAADWQLEELKKRAKRRLKAHRRSDGMLCAYGAGADIIEDFFEQIMVELRPQEES